MIDPYNDFISLGGKVWDRLKGVAEDNDCVPHMKDVVDAARTAGIGVFYAMHHRYRPGDYETWKYVAPIQRAAWSRKTFEARTWGGEIHPDLQLKEHGLHRLIVIGLIAHTCMEATVRYAAEVGYDVTVVRDATASHSDSEMHAALEVDMPNYAVVTTTSDVVGAMSGTGGGR